MLAIQQLCVVVDLLFLSVPSSFVDSQVEHKHDYQAVCPERQCVGAYAAPFEVLTMAPSMPLRTTLVRSCAKPRSLLGMMQVHA